MTPEPFYQRSLAILQKALGPDHLDVATSLINLAKLYETQGRHAEAEPLYQRSLAIREKVLGPDHPDVGLVTQLPRQTYQSRGRYADAEPLYKRTQTIYEKEFSSVSKKEEAAAQATAGAAEELLQPPTGGQATAEYYGGSGSPTNPAWAAEAAMNPNYKRKKLPHRQPQPRRKSWFDPRPAAKQRRNITAAINRQRSRWAAEAAMNPNYKKEGSIAVMFRRCLAAGLGCAEFANDLTGAAEAAMNPNYKRKKLRHRQPQARRKSWFSLQPPAKQRRNITAAVDRRAASRLGSRSGV